MTEILLKGRKTLTHPSFLSNYPKKKKKKKKQQQKIALIRNRNEDLSLNSPSIYHRTDA